MPSDPGPMVRRRQLATSLRRYRDEAGLSLKDVAEHLLCSPTKISRIETAQRNAGLRDVRDLCDLYGITDQGERERLMDLARQSREYAWWQSLELDSALAKLIGLESAATTISILQITAIPGLLQTRDYAEAILSNWITNDPNTLKNAVDLRMRRQDILGGPLLNTVFDEGALHRMVGSPDVMRDQVLHLIDLMSSSRISLQVIPFSAGVHQGMTSGFTVLEFEQSTTSTIEPSLPSVVYVEGITSDLYFDQSTDVERHLEVFKALQALTLSPEETLGLLRSAID